jgi:uncharacterized protein
MSAQSIINGFEFAESGRTLRGSVPLSDFPRLCDVLAEIQGRLEYVVAGVRDDNGRLALRIALAGSLRVRCQRCLGALELPVDIDSMLILASSLDEIEAEPVAVDGADWVLAAKEMKVCELLEDELLLEVPVAPRHDRCDEEDGRTSSGKAGTSPFAGLRDLMSDSQRRTKQG